MSCLLPFFIIPQITLAIGVLTSNRRGGGDEPPFGGAIAWRHGEVPW